MRDDNYLQSRLDHIWDRYFSDIEQKNDVRIQFGRKARSRLGSIKQSQAGRISNNQFLSRLRSGQAISNERLKTKNKKDSGPLASDAIARMTREEAQNHKPTIITINGLFKDKSIPEFLIDSVIAHEMVHYAHGFASPHGKKYATPHAGGVIRSEMKERGLEDLFILQKKWLKENWKEFVEKKMPAKLRARKRKRTIFIFK